MNSNKTRLKASALLAAAGTAAAAVYAVGCRLFFGLAFERKPLIKMGESAYGHADMIDRGKKWLHANDHDVRSRVASDGTRLFCHYFPAENAKCTLIEFHGWRGAWDMDFSASSPYLHELGCNLLLIEQRGQGRSEGDYMTFGIKERFDVPEWVQWYQDNYDPKIPILITGISMGATTVLMASCEQYPPQVKGILSDCGFNAPYDIIRHVSKDMYHLPEHPGCDSMELMLKWKTGVSLHDFSAVEAVSRATLPILFIHGKADTFVPPAMSEEIYAACTSRKELWLVDNAIHGNSFLVEREEYERRVMAFFAEIFEQGE